MNPNGNYNGMLQRIVELAGWTPQAQQSAYREDDGEERGHPECDKRPDEEESSAGLSDLAADSYPGHVHDGHQQP